MVADQTHKAKSKTSCFFIYALKLTLSVLAISYLVKMAGKETYLAAISSFGFLFILIATLLYIFSQWVSAVRLGVFFKLINTQIGLFENFKLYLIGMSYNLFLPGGIGGDGYKYVVLKRDYNSSGNPTLHAILLERLCGLASIAILLSIVASFWRIIQFQSTWFLLLSAIFYIIAYYSCKRFFPAFLVGFHKAMVLSFVVQAIQIFTICFIAFRLGVNSPLEISGVFLLSTLATAIPVFLGGVGARELVFASFGETLGVESSLLVSIAIVFSICMVLSAIPGLFLDWMQKRRRV
ncbi:flippase-like domain-containing protein [Bacteroidia bacterium]|nr:flippase-like domain-containing protein [Bacteroidia bacterium]MDB9882958.1 flippase-like domain-containing protein [Bacteroidia bacterium]